MQFRVPQFIDMEDKIIGPLTLKQFGYVLGAGGMAFLIWTFVPIKILAILLIVPIVALFLALAFIKINNRPFGDILENAFSYYTNSKIYTWKQPTPSAPDTQQPVAASTLTTAGEKVLVDTQKEIEVKKIDQDKLHDLSLGLDVLDHNSQDNKVK